MFSAGHSFSCLVGRTRRVPMGRSRQIQNPNPLFRKQIPSLAAGKCPSPCYRRTEGHAIRRKEGRKRLTLNKPALFCTNRRHLIQNKRISKTSPKPVMSGMLPLSAGLGPGGRPSAPRSATARFWSAGAGSEVHCNSVDVCVDVGIAWRSTSEMPKPRNWPRSWPL